MHYVFMIIIEDRRAVTVKSNSYDGMVLWS